MTENNAGKDSIPDGTDSTTLDAGTGFLHGNLTPNLAPRFMIAFRYSSVDLTEGLVQGGEMDIATIQFSWALTKAMGLSLNYKRTWTDHLESEGVMDGFIARVVLVLQ